MKQGDDFKGLPTAALLELPLPSPRTKELFLPLTALEGALFLMFWLILYSYFYVAVGVIEEIRPTWINQNYFLSTEEDLK